MTLKQLHVLESPLLHGQPATNPPVHVIWDPEEFSQWEIDQKSGDLLIWNYTGESWVPQDGGPVNYVQGITHIIVRGMYLKVWVEDFRPTHKSTHQAEEPTQPDYPIGWDKNAATSANFDVVIPTQRAGLPEIEPPTEPEPPVDEAALVTRVEDDGDQGKQVELTETEEPTLIRGRAAVVRLDERVEEPPKKIDYGTLTMPLAVSTDIHFFDGQPNIDPPKPKGLTETLSGLSEPLAGEVFTPSIEGIGGPEKS